MQNFQPDYRVDANSVANQTETHSKCSLKDIFFRKLTTNFENRMKCLAENKRASFLDVDH